MAGKIEFIDNKPVLTPQMEEAYFKIVLLSIVVSQEPKVALKLMENDPSEVYNRARSASVKFSKFQNWIMRELVNDLNKNY